MQQLPARGPRLPRAGPATPSRPGLPPAEGGESEPGGLLHLPGQGGSGSRSSGPRQGHGPEGVPLEAESTLALLPALHFRRRGGFSLGDTFCRMGFPSCLPSAGWGEKTEF